MLREELYENKGEFNGRRVIAVNLKVVFGWRNLNLQLVLIPAGYLNIIGFRMIYNYPNNF